MKRLLCLISFTIFVVFFLYGDSTINWGKSGVISDEFLGRSVATADINGDGINEIFVSSGNESVIVFFCDTIYGSYIPSETLTVSSPSATNGSGFGTAIVNMGDINGDKCEDVAISAPSYSEIASNAGAVFIFYGSTSGLSQEPNDTITVSQANAYFGYSLGFTFLNDYILLIGSPLYDSTYTDEGAVFCYGVKAESFIQVLEGHTNGEYFGNYISTGGDYNGNGYNDAIISSAYKTYLYIYDGSELSDKDGWVINKRNTSSCFYPDINRDGQEEIVIGVPSKDTVLLFLSSELSVGDTIADAIIEGEISGSNFGYRVAPISKLHDEGSDLVITAPYYPYSTDTRAKTGKLYVYDIDLNVEIGSMTVTKVFDHEGTIGASTLPDSTDLGKSLAIGDINNDGYEDILVGCPEYDINATKEVGRVEGIYGKLRFTTTLPSQLAVGDPITFEWFKSATGGDNVEILYSTNGWGGPYTSLGTTSNSGSFSINVPSANTDYACFMIRGVNYPYMSDTIGTYAIHERQLTITTPTQDTIWYTGDTDTIKWSSYLVGDSVKIEFSVDGGVNWGEIANSAPNTGEYVWTIPAFNSNNAIIRITPLDYPSLADISDTFTISEGSITITYPTSTDTVKTPLDSIKWTWTGNTNNVKIEYSLDKGNTWNYVIITTPNDGLYESWSVPDTSADSCLIRITSLEYPAITTTSDYFAIRKRHITVLYPNGGETIYYGSIDDTLEIRWDSYDVGDSVEIYVSEYGGYGWILWDKVPNTGSYKTTNLGTNNGTNMKIKVSSPLYGLEDESDSVFSYLPRYITILYPDNTVSTLTANTEDSIKWVCDGVENLIFTVECTNGDSVIIDTIPADSQIYVWTVPDTFINKSVYLCLISQTHSDIFNRTSSTFYIIPSSFVEETPFKEGEYIRVYGINGKIEIESNIKSSQAEINIYDIAGRKIKNFKISPSIHHLETDHLSAGLYFIHINYNGKERMLKINVVK